MQSSSISRSTAFIVKLKSMLRYAGSFFLGLSCLALCACSDEPSPCAIYPVGQSGNYSIAGEIQLPLKVKREDQVELTVIPDVIVPSESETLLFEECESFRFKIEKLNPGSYKIHMSLTRTENGTTQVYSGWYGGSKQAAVFDEASASSIDLQNLSLTEADFGIALQP